MLNLVHFLRLLYLSNTDDIDVHSIGAAARGLRLAWPLFELVRRGDGVRISTGVSRVNDDETEPTRTRSFRCQC